MTNTLLYDLLQVLDPQARKEARLWLESPLHNARTELLRLFLYLDKTRSKGKVPTKALAHEAMYPDKAFDDQNLRLASSRLLKCLEEWLTYRQWQAQSLEKGALLLQALRQHHLDKHFVRHARQQYDWLEAQPLRNGSYLAAVHQHLYEVYAWESRQGRGRPMNLQAQEDALQAAYLAEKLRMACLAISHQRVFNTAYDIAMLEEVLHLSGEAPVAQHISIQIYRAVFQMYRHPDEPSAFQTYRNLLVNNPEAFPEEERRDLILMGINFCIRQINRRGEAYLNEALGMYKAGLESGLVLEDGALSVFTYSNIVTIALQLHEAEWVEQFIVAYKNLLEPRRREAIFALNAARLAYYHGQHKQALLLLHRFEDRDFIHVMAARILQLKIFYESGDFTTLAAHIKNTRAQVRRWKSPGYHKDICLNMLGVTSQMMAMLPLDNARREQLRELIQTTEPLTERAWLLAQIEVNSHFSR